MVQFLSSKKPYSSVRSISFKIPESKGNHISGHRWQAKILVLGYVLCNTHQPATWTLEWTQAGWELTLGLWTPSWEDWNEHSLGTPTKFIDHPFPHSAVEPRRCAGVVPRELKHLPFHFCKTSSVLPAASSFLEDVVFSTAKQNCSSILLLKFQMLAG